MIIKGGCRGNGAALANYLMDNKDNSRADVFAISGTATLNNLKLSLIEMSLTSEFSGKTSKGLYHAQLSPRIEEALDMSAGDKLRMVEIFIEKMGMPKDTKWALVEQEKDDRIHFHLALERYNHDTRTMWKDDKNYKKHEAAARQMELEFGWELTYKKTDRLDKDIKNHIWDLWHKDGDATSFVAAMAKHGFEVTQGIGRRPYQFVDLHGTEFDLARQLDWVKQGEVAERLNPIRKELRETPIVCHERRAEAQKQERLEKQSDNLHEMSDSQDLMLGMKKYYNQENSKKGDSDEGEKTGSYTVNVTFSPFDSAEQEPQKQPDNVRELSDSQDLAAAMLKKQQQEKAKEKAPANDNDPLAKYRYNKGESPLDKYRYTENEISPLDKYLSDKRRETRSKARERTRERTRERRNDQD